MFFFGLFEFLGNKIKSLLNWHRHKCTIFADLGFGQPVLTVKSLNRMIAFHTAEPLVHAATWVSLHSHSTTIADPYKDPTACATKTARSFLPGNNTGVVRQLTPITKAYTWKDCSCTC